MGRSLLGPFRPSRGNERDTDRAAPCHPRLRRSCGEPNRPRQVGSERRLAYCRRVPLGRRHACTLVSAGDSPAEKPERLAGARRTHGSGRRLTSEHHRATPQQLARPQSSGRSVGLGRKARAHPRRSHQRGSRGAKVMSDATPVNTGIESILHREIYEQPDVLSRIIAREGPNAQRLVEKWKAHNVHYVMIAARGSSDNAATYGKYLLGALNG